MMGQTPASARAAIGFNGPGEGPPQRELEIPAAIKRLDDTTAQLSALVVNLLERLTPVMSDQPEPSTVLATKAPHNERVNYSELAGHVGSTTSTLCHLVATLERALDCLEL